MNTSDSYSLGGGYRICPVCKKEFHMYGDDWGYKRYSKKGKGLMLFCSWKCLRRHEAMYPNSQQKAMEQIRKELSATRKAP